MSCWKREKKVSIFSLLDCGSQQLLCFANTESYLRIFGQFQSGFSNIFLHCYAGFPWICEFASFLPLLIFCGLTLFSSTWLSFSSLIIVLKSNTSIPKVSWLGPVSEYNTSLEFFFVFLFLGFFLILIFSFLSFCFNGSQGTFSLLPCPQSSCSLWDIFVPLVMWHLAEDELAVFPPQLPSWDGSSRVTMVPRMGTVLCDSKSSYPSVVSLTSQGSCRTNGMDGILLIW